ncbi:MAG: septum formation protein Maf [Candidatus Schekmanbacteria bacterium]|nr:septum formation protein Maf [Candidatus Schekmanbacteria bacterium]
MPHAASPYAGVLLASASPRRAALLRQVGIPFEVLATQADEAFPEGMAPAAAARRVAERKAEAAGAARQGDAGVRWSAVLGADTIVVVAGEVLGKPRDADEARHMLKRLSNRSHEVITGVALLWSRPERRLESWSERTIVTFRAVSDEEIDAYVQSGGPLDKAGAYGIQEQAGAFVERLDGCCFNVMGLPLAKLTQRLALARNSARAHREALDSPFPDCY